MSPRNLTFFHTDFGKEFPSRTFWRDPSRNCPSPSSALFPFLYRTEHFSKGRKWRKCAEKRGGRGVASKGGKKEKRTRENRSGIWGWGGGGGEAPFTMKKRAFSVKTPFFACFCFRPDVRISEHVLVPGWEVKTPAFGASAQNCTASPATANFHLLRLL